MEYSIRTVREQEFIRITHIIRNMVQNIKI